MAMESDNISADAVEAAEFPYLAQRYAVHAVPKIIMNEETTVEGAVPENVFIEELKRAAGF